jgi:hypothetical protein
MGIEPTREDLPGPENKRFGAMVDAKCDGRANFRGMWGHVGLRRDTPVCGLEPFSRRSPTGQLRPVDDLAKPPVSSRSWLAVS